MDHVLKGHRHGDSDLRPTGIRFHLGNRTDNDPPKDRSIEGNEGSNRTRFPSITRENTSALNNNSTGAVQSNCGSANAKWENLFTSCGGNSCDGMSLVILGRTHEFNLMECSSLYLGASKQSTRPFNCRTAAPDTPVNGTVHLFHFNPNRLTHGTYMLLICDPESIKARTGCMHPYRSRT